MICSPCLSDLHEFCRDDVRGCDCDCVRWLVFGDDVMVYSCDDPPAPDEGWQDIIDDGPAQEPARGVLPPDRYERGLFRG